MVKFKILKEQQPATAQPVADPKAQPAAPVQPVADPKAQPAATAALSKEELAGAAEVVKNAAAEGTAPLSQSVEELKKTVADMFAMLKGLKPDAKPAAAPAQAPAQAPAAGKPAAAAPATPPKA